MKHSKLITMFSVTLLGTCLAIFSPCTIAKAEKSNGFEYTYDTETNEATIIGYNGSSSAVKIPDKLNGYTVTVIGEKAFYNKMISSVSIPNTVKAIKDEAFCADLFLQELSVPSSVKEIGTDAFALCKSMTHAEIKGAAKIDNYSFYGCTGLTDISFSSDVSYIGIGAFYNCTSLENVTIPEGVTKVDQAAFYGCSSLTSLTVLGPTELDWCSFGECPALAEVQLSDDSSTYRRNGYSAFYNCPSLYKVNGVQALQYQTDSNDIQYPVINPAIEPAIRNHFCRSMNVGFVNDYCTELCDYIVETETDDWMCDALKARQLHDWIIRHCELEDGKDGESNSDAENQIASSAFLSYAINTRGQGVGESVCAGYSRAYTMLLATAGVESYCIHNGSRAWNLVKIGNKYYHTDVLSDDYGNSGIRYSSFLKSTLRSGTEIKQLSLNEHPLLNIYQNDISGQIKECNESYLDNNNDGILDYDFDLDGVNIQYDFLNDLNAYQGMLQFAFGTGSNTEQINNRMSEVLAYLHAAHKDYWTYINESGPSDQSVHSGTKATFKVTLFGDDLKYQWQYYNTSTGKWTNVSPSNVSTSATLCLTAATDMNNRKFRCIVKNKNGQSINSNVVILKVV